MIKTPRIALTCGGTGGHVYPLIAVAQEIGSHDVVFLCSKDRPDRQIIQRYGFAHIPIDGSATNPLVMMRSFFDARDILTRSRVQLVVGSGGYLTLPVVMAAASLRLPIVLLEQNIIAGTGNRWLSRFAAEVCVSFSETQSEFNAATCSVTGNPVRKQFVSDGYSESILDWASKRSNVILVMGGSQGALGINAFIEQHLTELGSEYNLIHLMGDLGFSEAFPGKNEAVERPINENSVIAAPFAERIDEIMACAQCVIGRAGATTIAELMAYRRPALLIPFPYAKDDHQTKNARYLSGLGIAEYFSQDELDISTVMTSLKRLRATSESAFPNKVNAREAVVEKLKRHLS